MVMDNEDNTHTIENKEVPQQGTEDNDRDNGAYQYHDNTRDHDSAAW